MYCKGCEKDLHEDCFSKCDSKRGKQLECKQCLKLSSKQWRETNKQRASKYRKEYYEKNKLREKNWGRDFHDNNPNYSKHLHMLRRFGVTPEQFESMLNQQGGGCYLCGVKHNVAGRRLCLDHCHTTGVVRGILCTVCNLNVDRDTCDQVEQAKRVAYRERDPFGLTYKGDSDVW